MTDEIQLTEEQRNLQISTDNVFEASLQAANKDNYLGDPDIIRAYLITQIGRFADAAKVKNQIESVSLLNIIIKSSARVLLGQNTDYSPVPGWNRPGRIDAALARYINSTETDPNKIVQQTLLKMFGEIADVAEYASDDAVLDEQWHPQMDEIIDRYRDLFMGVPVKTRVAVDVTEEKVKVE